MESLTCNRAAQVSITMHYHEARRSQYLKLQLNSDKKFSTGLVNILLPEERYFYALHVHGTNRKIWVPMRSWILDLQLIPPSTWPVPASMRWWWARPLITRFISSRLSTPDINCSVNQNNSVTRPFPCSRVREGNPVWISKFSHQLPKCSEPRNYPSMSVHLFLSLRLVSQSINLPQTKLQTSEYTAVSA